MNLQVQISRENRRDNIWYLKHTLALRQKRVKRKPYWAGFRESLMLSRYGDRVLRAGKSVADRKMQQMLLKYLSWESRRNG